MAKVLNFLKQSVHSKVHVGPCILMSESGCVGNLDVGDSVTPHLLYRITYTTMMMMMLFN